MRRIVITENEAGQRLDRFIRKLMKKTPLGEIYKAIRKGNIKVNGKKSKENYMLSVDDVVTLKNMDYEVTPKDKKTISKASNIAIVYEDQNIIVVDKPAGLLSHPQSSKDVDTLIQRIKYYIQSTEGTNLSPTFSISLCNRLDRNTAGLVVAAKNYGSLKGINEMIRERDLKKFYLCVVKGSTDLKGQISGSLGKDEKNKKALLTDKGRDSVTYYEKKYDNGQYSLLLVELVTGRFHQIRAHLSSIGHPIVGDVKYGDKNINKYFHDRFGLKHQFLLAHTIKIEDAPQELEYLKGMEWHSHIPKVFENIIEHLFKRQIL